MSQYDVDLRDYWRIIKKRKMIIILMTIFVSIGSYAFSKFKEPTPLYRADAAVKIEQQTDMSLFRSGGFWSQGESMYTHAYTMTSFPVLKSAGVALERIPSGLSDTEIQQNQQYWSAIERIKGMVSTDLNERTSIIDIKVVSTNPAEAANVANAIAAAYREFNIAEKNQRTIDARAFIESQMQVMIERLRRAEGALRDFREANGMYAVSEKTREINLLIVSAGREKEAVIQEIMAVTQQLDSISADQDDEAAAAIAKQLTYTPRESPLYGQGVKLEALLSQRQHLLSKYTEKHPSVADVANQIQRIVTDARNDLKLYLASLGDRQLRLDRQITALEDEARILPEKENQLARLEMEVNLQEKLYSELQTRHQEVLIQESGQQNFVTLVKPAMPPSGPFNIPSKMVISFTGIILGLILGLVFGFGVEMFDTSMGTIEDVETSLQVPVLGVIPNLDAEDSGKRGVGKNMSEAEQTRNLITHYDPKSIASEAFRSVRTNLQFSLSEKKSKTFLVTSAFVKEGKTLTAVNMALSLAQTGKKVLLIDADLRRSMIHKIFDLPRSPGLTDYVLGEYSWSEIVNTITDVMLGGFEIDGILKTPGLDRLHMITSGTKPPNPTEILSSSRFREMLKEASAEYGYILIDAPPVLPVADPCEIAPYTDGVILVYTVGRIARGVLKRAKTTLDNSNARVIGVILNNVRPEVGPDYFKYQAHYYYGTEKQPETLAGGIKKFWR